MKRKISLFLVLVLTISMCVTNITACFLFPDNGSENPGNTDAENFHLIREMIMNEEKHLLVFNKTENLSFEELVLAQAIQGIYARTSARYYQWSSGSYDLWLQQMVNDYGYTMEYVTLEQMVKSYIQDYDNKYVLYDRSSLAETTNSACAISGVTGYLPIDAKIKEKAEKTQ